MEWDILDLGELGQRSCGVCEGIGGWLTKDGGVRPCICSLRTVFRGCYDRYRQCVRRERRITQVSYKETPIGKSHRGTWSRKEEEYIADFERVSRRNLDDWHYRLFRYHYVLGADWKLCSRKLGIKKGYFFHGVYRIEQRLGRVFFELEPYSLYPPHDYFTFRLPGPIEPSCVEPSLTPKPPEFHVRKPALRAAISDERVSA